MTNKEIRTLMNCVLKRIRRELADVPCGTQITIGRRIYRWTGEHIESLITSQPEEEWEWLVYVHLTRAQIERIIAKFRQTLMSKDNRAEQKRIQDLKAWASQ